MSIVRELRRRNVFRVAIAYLALAWLLIEVADTLFPAFGVPEWGVRFLAIVFALGFLPALILSWIYELTPNGVMREKDVRRQASITHQTARRLDIFTIGLVVVAFLFVAADRFLLNPEIAQQVPPQAVEITESRRSSGGDSERSLDSIAVLPFANRSANPNDSFFVDGIHDDLLTYISQISSIKTISRTSVMKYRDSELSIPEIAEELGVATVLEGGVQRAGDQVRINIQLIDANTDDHLWSKTYDRQLTATNIFAIQSEVASMIAAALRATLSHQARNRIDDVPTDNLTALEAYFVGRQSMVTRTVVDLAKAAEEFEKAVALDPDFALAYVGMADTYLLQAAYTSLPWTEMLARSQAASETAIQLSPWLGEAYAAFAKKKSFDREYEEAEAAFKKAIELSPNYAPGYQWYGEMLGGFHNRIAVALEISQKAVELDPKSAIIRNDYAEVLEKAGRFGEAMENYRLAIETEPRFAQGYFRIAMFEAQVNGRFDEAVRNLRMAYAIDPESPLVAYTLVWAYINLGDSPKAAEWLNRLQEIAGGDHWFAVTAEADLLIAQGDNTHAMKYARKRLEWEPWDNWALMRVGHYEISAGQAANMLPGYKQVWPELVDKDPHVDGSSVIPAIELALVLQNTGSTESADRLLEQSLVALTASPLPGTHEYVPQDARIRALLGNNNEALTILHRAVESGWRKDWWYYFEHDPAFNALRDKPQFEDIRSLVAADMAAQLERLNER